MNKRFSKIYWSDEMLGKFELKLRCAEEINYQMASLFHGVLMELIPSEYADYLHLSQLHPYSQHLEYRDETWYWIICGLNKEAVQTIIVDSVWNVNRITLKKKNIKIDIIQRKYIEISYQELMDHFYETENSPYINVHFIAPTAFKQKGKYVFYPDLRGIYQSLMSKYDSAARDEGMVDEETLEQLCENSQIVRYDLKSVNFFVEKVKIPAFIGKITIKLTGTKTMTNFANMLFEFGEYSGIGIKTSLGMGCIKLNERGRK